MTSTPRPAAPPEVRLAGLREVIRAANGDWHDATALWSVQDDLDWLLSHAAEAAQREAGLRAALKWALDDDTPDVKPDEMPTDEWDRLVAEYERNLAAAHAALQEAP